MKRLGALCTCISVLLLGMVSGFAEGTQFIDERMPKVYQASYSSNTGKVVFQIDAIVDVPHVTSVPLYEASTRRFTPEEVKTLADVLLPNHQCLYNEDGQWTELTEAHPEISRKFGIYYIPQSATRSMEAYNDWGTYVSGEYSTIDENLDYACLAFMHTLPMENVYYNLSGNMSGDGEDERFEGSQIQGSRYTLDEAQALANGVISQIAPELQLLCVCTTEASYYYSEADEDRHNDPNDPFKIDPALVEEKLIPGYVFTYIRNVDHIPVTYTTTNCGVPETYGMLTDYEKCFVIVGNRGIEYVGYENPMQCGEMIQPSCELLPFSDISSVAQSIMPIKYDAIYSSPTYSSVTFTIDRITLGYMRVMVKDAANQYQLIPVWDFFGTGECTYPSNDTRTFNVSPNGSLLTINAMDGTVIDRSYGY